MTAKPWSKMKKFFTVVKRKIEDDTSTRIVNEIQLG
jgi:hypothetical protein